MATRRMFSLDVVNTDAFLDLPVTAQALYFHLGMRADDDGFVGSPVRIMRSIGGEMDDLENLVNKGYIIRFDSGVIAITHWKWNNQIRKDRYNPTMHTLEKSLIVEDEAKKYLLVSKLATVWQPHGNRMETQNRIEKDNLDEESIEVEGKGERGKGEGGEPSRSAAPPPINNHILPFPENQKIMIPLVDGFYHVPAEQIEAWSQEYPSVDLRKELSEMAAWLTDNPEQKTDLAFIYAYINDWLANAND